MALQIDIVNYKKSAQKIYVTFDVEYLPGKTGPDSASVLLSLTGCSSPAFMLVEKEVNATSDTFRIFEDGAIINASKLFLSSQKGKSLTCASRGPSPCTSNPKT
jgi:hypothetical protein